MGNCVIICSQNREVDG